MKPHFDILCSDGAWILVSEALSLNRCGAKAAGFESFLRSHLRASEILATFPAYPRVAIGSYPYVNRNLSVSSRGTANSH